VWTISSLIFGGISIFASGTFNPGWGIVMIVIGILSWKIKTPAMFVIYGVMIGWAAVMNGLVVLQGEEIWLLVLALLQVYWTVSIAKQYRKYRHLRLRELYEAGNWPGNLTPPADQAVISCRFAIASTSLAGITMILLPISCFGMFAYIILLQEAMAEQAAWLNQFSMQATGIVMEVMIGIAVLALGLGLAAILSGSQRKGLAIAGTVMSAIVLVSWIGFILLMTIIQLTSQPGVVPSTG
jgi:hypothetical protein